MSEHRSGRRSADAAWSALTATPDGVVVCADDWTILYINPVAAALLNRTVESLVGTMMWEAIPEARGTELHTCLLRALGSSSDAEPVRWSAYHEPAHGWFSDMAWRVGDHVVALFARMDELPAAEATPQRMISDVEAALRRSQVMLTASEAFLAATTTAEVSDAAATLMDGTLAAPRYVDIALADRDGEHLTRLRPDDIPAEIRHRYRRIPIGADLPPAEVMRTGRGVFIEDLDELAARYPHLHADWAAPDRQAIACAPVLGQDGSVGALVCVWARPHPMDVRERALIMTVAGYVGHALARVRALEHRVAAAESRYEDTRAALEMMQRRLLPERLPVIPGVRVAAHYRVADRDNAAGGDWFDAIPVGDGTLALMVGDVVGHGAAAAAVMAQLRAVLSGFVVEGTAVVDALTRLDRIAARLPGARGTTVCLAVLDPDRRVLRYASCGHPPPLVVGRDGTARYLAVHGGPLGVAAPVPTLREHSLDDMDMMLLYSDGLVERPGQTMGAGLSTLSRAAVDARRPDAGAGLDQVCAQVVAQLAHPGHGDDITLLAAEIGGDRSDLPTIEIDSRHPGPGAVRRKLGAWLTRMGAGDDDVVDVQLAVMEAVENAVEHGYRDAPGDVRVDAHLDRRGRASFVITDRGRWRPPPTQPRHRGRGLAMMQDCMDDVEVERLESGTVVSFDRELRRRPAFGDREAVREEPEDTDDELTMDLHQRGEELMLVLTGPVDVTSSAALRGRLQNLTRGGSTSLSMNLGAVTHIGSSGVTVLYEVAEAMRYAGHTMRLIAPSGTPAHHVLGLSGLGHITEHLEHDRLPDGTR